jgi:hypothetical protein
LLIHLVASAEMRGQLDELHERNAQLENQALKRAWHPDAAQALTMG